MTVSQPSRTATDDAYYLYGVMPTRSGPPGDVTGVGGARDFLLLESGELALLASPIEPDREVATREDLLAHSRVLDTVAATSDVLPLRFGTVAEPDAVEQSLEGRLDQYTELLADLEGAVQYTLRARYLKEPVLREIVAEDEEIARLRNITRQEPPEAVYGQSVRLGELVVDALGRKASADAATLLDTLAPLTRAVEAREPAAAEDVVDAALLVDRTDREALEDAVERLGEDVSSRIRLRLIGPQAPYDFVPGD